MLPQITLQNGHSFRYACAAGALGFTGDGYPWEWPARWLGLLRPDDFTIITKTLTATPRVGNFRSYAPWRCFRLLGGGNYVNAVGLTNKGLSHWLISSYPRIKRMPHRKVIVSVMPDTLDQAITMARALESLNMIVGVEMNASCPNVSHNDGADHVCELADGMLKNMGHPLIVKMAVDQPIREIMLGLCGRVAAFDLINAVKWDIMFPGRTSPLAKYGYNGGVSGPIIGSFARRALAEAASMSLPTPLISGGGISSSAEALSRFNIGASAVTLGVRFLRQVWHPNQIVSETNAALEGLNELPVRWRHDPAHPTPRPKMLRKEGEQ